MLSYAFGVTYDGADFHGWQRQADLPTVQSTLEQALSQIADAPTMISVAGRTDAGVHAIGQVGAFSSDASRSLQDWKRGLNALTPTTIRVDWVVLAPEEFHPRYSATARRYVYLFHDTERAHPMLAKRVWSCAHLDADAMHRAGRVLLGEHDFSSFRGAGCQALSPLRRVNRCEVTRRGEFVVLDIEANAFVLHMVRNIAAGLQEVGTCKRAELRTLLDAKDRTQLGPTAPPDGLYLVEVSYPGQDLPAPATLPFLGL